MGEVECASTAGDRRHRDGVGAYALVPVGVRLVLPLPGMVADALADLSPREAVVAFAFLGVWLRTHPGRQPLRSSVDMLLPHG